MVEIVVEVAEERFLLSSPPRRDGPPETSGAGRNRIVNPERVVDQRL